MQTRLRGSDLPALGAAALIAGYGAYLVLIGPIFNIVVPDGGASSSRQPNIAGLLFVSTGLLVWLGVVRRSEMYAWMGAALAAAFSVLFVFSIGAVVIPITAFLLVALALRRMTAKQSRGR
jgi:hypothetical protein